MSPPSDNNWFLRADNFWCCVINKFFAAFISCAFKADPGDSFKRLAANVSVLSTPNKVASSFVSFQDTTPLVCFFIPVLYWLPKALILANTSSLDCILLKFKISLSLPSRSAFFKIFSSSCKNSSTAFLEDGFGALTL